LAVLNPGFETDDPADPGLPDDWTLDTSSQWTSGGEEAAGYDDGSGAVRPLPSERFEGGWSSNESYVFAFDDPPNLAQVEFAFYNAGVAQGFEGFEDEWGNDGFSFELGSVGAASYDSSTPEDVEDFEEEWSANEDFAFDLTGVSTTSATYDVADEDVEDFEEEWSANEDFAFDLTGVSTTSSTYDTGVGGGSENFEDFEEVLPEFSVSPDFLLDTFTATAHGLSNGQAVFLRNEDGVLPAGLFEGFKYFVVGASANTFQLAATSGGAAINFTDNGHGTQYVIPDGAVFWLTVMTTL
jgi:hypothetical protein